MTRRPVASAGSVAGNNGCTRAGWAGVADHLDAPDAPDGADADATGVAPVTFFWRPGCGFCSRLRRDLVGAGVELDERNIWEDPEAAAFVRSVARGNETVPTVVVRGTALVNPPAREVVALLG
jgi:glutaredoxin